MGYRVAVVGSRDFWRRFLPKATALGLREETAAAWARLAAREFVEHQLETLVPAATEIVSGGARGVDTYAETFGKQRGIPVKVFYPDWSTGRDAGFRRNTDIVERGEVIIAFWDGRSKGTRDSIAKAHNRGKPVIVVFGSGKQRRNQAAMDLGVGA